MTQISMSDMKDKGRLITDWRPEDAIFWKLRGQFVARRNLWISIFCLLLAYCVWMLFSALAVNLNHVGFSFSADQLFMLAALPSVSGTLLRVAYSFMVPIFGGRRWTAVSTGFLIIPCVWLGFAVQNPKTTFETFVIIALLCGFAGANFASSMGNISFFYPKDKQGQALGYNGGLGNIGVSLMQLVVPIAISVSLFSAFGSAGKLMPDGETLWLENAAWIWVIPLGIATLLAWFGMNDLAMNKTSVGKQFGILKNRHLWVLGLLYLASYGSFIGFAAAFAMLSTIEFPEVEILYYAFFGPFLGALARSVGGIMADRFSGVLVTALNFVVMALLILLLIMTLPDANSPGSFVAFFSVFMLLFITAGLGSGSTYQMIAVVFRKSTADKIKAQGGSQEEAERHGVADTATALGFISVIGASGGFFIPKVMGSSLAMTGSVFTAMLFIFVLYILSITMTWLVYGRRKGC
ncbi:nitrate/nitrite transporter NarK [Yersinia entomophaga]|uniref:Nitrate/nitrite transporter n=1 Tax=Yersinia entomophaga TaxID=935293 RepID=A0ABN4PTL9_YERET|nr:MULTISPECIES: NarK family nitrate/nitrite MFS transporter [Yersinia]ANI29225.1 nitrate/nitrite transporter NarK [Yersinia entomophaga]OWF89257.1 NarK family nitrate/nitrite MFS transporter [Yersinia entomophaga]